MHTEKVIFASGHNLETLPSELHVHDVVLMEGPCHFLHCPRLPAIFSPDQHLPEVCHALDILLNFLEFLEI